MFGVICVRAPQGLGQARCSPVGPETSFGQCPLASAF